MTDRGFLEYERLPKEEEKKADSCSFWALAVGFYGGLFTVLVGGVGFGLRVFTLGGKGGVLLLCFAYLPEVVAVVLGCIGIWNCGIHGRRRTGMGMAVLGIILAMVWSLPVWMALLD
jgi:hypothetical protein